jgi:hypothetical protein
MHSACSPYSDGDRDRSFPSTVHIGVRMESIHHAKTVTISVSGCTQPCVQSMLLSDESFKMFNFVIVDLARLTRKEQQKECPWINAIYHLGQTVGACTLDGRTKFQPWKSNVLTLRLARGRVDIVASEHVFETQYVDC